MSESYTEEIEDWLRDLTIADWGDSLPTHCMSSRYQRLNPRAWPFPGAPSFKADSFSSESPIEETGDEASEDDLPLSGTNKVIELTSQTHSYFKDYVSGEKKRPGELRNEVEHIKSSAEDLARQIDEEFKIVRERSDQEVEELQKRIENYPALAGMIDTSKRIETNIVKESRRLLQLLSRAIEKDPEMKFEDVIRSDATVEEKNWHLEYKQSPSAYLEPVLIFSRSDSKRF